MTCYGIPAIVSVILGLIYLFSSEFMPYHSEALGQEWKALSTHLQTLLLALMDVAGGGWLGFALAIGFLLAWPFRQGQTWARYLIPMLILVVYLPTLWATLIVNHYTPASPPWYGNALNCLVALLGLLVDQPWQQSSK